MERKEGGGEGGGNTARKEKGEGRQSTKGLLLNQSIVYSLNLKSVPPCLSNQYTFLLLFTAPASKRRYCKEREKWKEV